MWGTRQNRGEETVTCIACGESVGRSEAREYDKYGDRWDREGKAFEHLCKTCYRELCHQPRAELEALLVESGTGGDAREAFLARYGALVEEEYGPLEEHEP
jgi:hypothetical protein